MTGSHDVAHHHQTLEEYGVTHILNLACNEIENLFEDEFNYSNLDLDENQCNLMDYLEEAFDFMEEGTKRGNILIHCNANKPGLSRSTSICIAYLMKIHKKPLTEAFNDVSIG